MGKGRDFFFLEKKKGVEGEGVIVNIYFLFGKELGLIRPKTQIKNGLKKE